MRTVYIYMFLKQTFPWKVHVKGDLGTNFKMLYSCSSCSGKLNKMQITIKKQDECISDDAI